MQAGLRLSLFRFFFLTTVIMMLPLPALAEGAFKRHITVYGNSPLLERYPREIAENYNLVITEWWKSKASISTLKTINPNVTLLFYRDLNGLFTDYDDWKIVSQHPAWFIKDKATNKRLVHKVFGWYLMDITNAEFRLHLQQYIQNKLSNYPLFDGVFLDDTFANINSANYVVEGGTTPSTFDPNYVQAYRTGVISFLKELKVSLEGKLVIINSDDRSEYIQYADGIMVEGFPHGAWQNSDYYISTVDWLTSMQTLGSLLKTDKLILIHAGSRGAGDKLQKQFIFCFATFLLISNESTYFHFDTPSSQNQLLPYPQYFQNLGNALEFLPPETFAATAIERSLTDLGGWAIQGDPPSLAQKDGFPALQFVSNGANGSYLSRCFEIGASNALSISCTAKGNRIRSGNPDWIRFALLGKFYDVNKRLIRGGVDLPFDLGSYDWKAYTITHQVLPGTQYYCVSALGFYPPSTGMGWVRDLKLKYITPAKQLFTRQFEGATVLINPTISAFTDSVSRLSLTAETAAIIFNR